MTDKPRVRVSSEGQVMAHYEGASVVHPGMRDWFAPTTDADAAVDGFDRDTLIDRSHDSYRNNTIARAVIEARVNGAVGNGLRFQSTIDAERAGISEEQAREIEDRIEYDFDLFARDPDFNMVRTQNFYQAQATIMRSAELAGDCFVLLPFEARRNSAWGLKFQMVDGQRVSNPNNAQNTSRLAFGIAKNEYGAPTAVHIQESHPGSTYLDKKFTWAERQIYGQRTGRRNVLHYFNPERVDQTRGVPTLAPILSLLKETGTYVASEVRAAVVTSYFTVLLLKDSTAAPADPNKPALPSAGNAGGKQPVLKPGELSMGAGSIVELPHWFKDAKFADPSRPNADAPEFVALMIKLMSGAAGLPMEVVLKVFQSSYSASRAARLEAFSTYKMLRESVAMNLCQPVLNAFIDEAVAAGIYDLPGYEDPYRRQAYLRGNWIGPSMGEIDEFKAWQAAEKAYQLGGKSLDRISREMTGEPIKSVIRQKQKEEFYGKRVITAGASTDPGDGGAEPIDGDQPGSSQFLPKAPKGARR